MSESIDIDKDGNSLSLMDVISMDDDMLENISARETYKKLRIYVDEVLTDRESKIIKLRYGLNNEVPKTQKEIADICKISRSYVSRIEKRALMKLEDALRPEE